MPTLVVTTQGARVRCTGGQIVVEVEKTSLQRIPCETVERVLLMGRVGVSTGFLDFALLRRISVTFLSQDGGYKGRLDSDSRRDIAVRIAQYKGLENVAWRVGIAREIMKAKVSAQRALLLRCARNHPHQVLTTAAAILGTLSERADHEATLPGLMGLEGSSARAYFAALPAALRRPMPFHGRSRRPPKDPMNALLSLGYGMLTTEIIGALMGVGLDPQIGIFHSPRGRVPALAEDVIEMFRAPVADALALSLVNLGVLDEHDFHPTDDGGVALTPKALERYFRHYRRRMTARFADRRGVAGSFRQHIQLHCAHLRRVILGQEGYHAFEAPQGGVRDTPR